MACVYLINRPITAMFVPYSQVELIVESIVQNAASIKKKKKKKKYYFEFFSWVDFSVLLSTCLSVDPTI